MPVPRLSERIMLRTFLSVIASLVLVACSKPARQAKAPTPSPVETPRPTSPAANVPAKPPPIDPNAPKETGSGSTGDYDYTFEKRGDMTVANFAPQRLPFVQEIVEAAARNVVQTVYGEKMEDFPRRVPWEYEDRKHAIMLTGASYDYVFVHIEDENREIPKLIFWRVPKDSVRY